MTGGSGRRAADHARTSDGPTAVSIGIWMLSRWKRFASLRARAVTCASVSAAVSRSNSPGPASRTSRR